MKESLQPYGKNRKQNIIMETKSFTQDRYLIVVLIAEEKLYATKMRNALNLLDRKQVDSRGQ